MASNDLGPAPVMVGTPAHADDAIRGDVEVRTPKGSIVEADAKPVAPDQFEPKYETGKYELWAYYSYYIGNNVSWSFLLEGLEVEIDVVDGCGCRWYERIGKCDQRLG
jgi:hypothetical protein